jgi:hypothetical protein
MKYLWLFEPDALITLPVMTAVLFALGGSGFKFLRRLGVPALILASCLSQGKNGLLAVVAVALLSIALSKGYGDELKDELGPYYYSTLYSIGAIYGFTLMPLASELWHFFYCLIPCLTFGSLTYTSQQFDFPRWKWVELATGFSIGLVAYLLIK